MASKASSPISEVKRTISTYVVVGKTKVMRIVEGSRVHDEGKFPCAICGKRVVVNSIECTECMRWNHTKYSGIKGRLPARAGDFKCIRCKQGRRSEDE